MTIAWALYRVFLPVSGGLTALAAAFRLVYAGVYLVAISHLVGVPGLLLFGLHLLLIGHLAYRSGFVPRWLGVLLANAFSIPAPAHLLENGATR